VQERKSGEDVAVCDVLNIGEIEQVCVLANLELGLSLAIRANDLGK
jgi:hypothetical protein